MQWLMGNQQEYKVNDHLTRVFPSLQIAASFHSAIDCFILETSLEADISFDRNAQWMLVTK